MIKLSLACLFSLVSLTPGTAADLTPQPIDYASIAFYPDRWKSEEVDELDMVAWEGEKIALVTTIAKLDPIVLGKVVGTLDSAYSLFADLTGYAPRVNRCSLNGKSTICALPKPNLSCGYGCGYVGSTGIEMIEFYDVHYPDMVKNPLNIPHCYFYEMGRNYYGFGRRHSCFTTGFAVFMRYVCIDTLKTFDKEPWTRQTVDSAINLFEKSDMSFVAAFTDKAGTGEKGNRLKDENGRAISPSDQNVMYASLMLKLSRENGGNAFIKRFYTAVNSLPEINPGDEESARKQCVNLMIAASAAAQKDLTAYFTDRLRLEITETEQEQLNKINWSTQDLNLSDIASR